MISLSRENRNKIAVGLLIFFVLFSIVSATTLFSKNLKFGDRSDDVLQLQKVLNQNSQTQVAPSGPGSPGNETSYFGPLTYGAVIRFQELYKNEVLLPINLLSGTGFVGSFTREKLNSFIGAGVKEKDPAIKEIVSVLLKTTPDSAQPGHFVSLYGSGFEDGDIIYVSDIKSPKINVKNAGLITFIVPHGLSAGNNPVKLKRNTSFSNEISLRVVLQEVGHPVRAVITELSPSSGTKGTVLTIKGERFSDSNIVSLGYDIIDNVKSIDGKTITVTINPPWSKYKEEYSAVMPFWVYVDNGEGISNVEIFKYQL